MESKVETPPHQPCPPSQRAYRWTRDSRIVSSCRGAKSL